MIETPYRVRPVAILKGVLGVLALAWPAAIGRGQDEAGRPKHDPVRLEIRRTQVTIALVAEGVESRFQATVIAKGERAVTVLTAAHCLSPDDVGKDVRINQGRSAFPARIDSVARNPNFHPARDGEVPGVDNALAVLRWTPGDAREAEAFDAIRVAELTARPLPDPSGRAAFVHVVDQFGEEHTIRAGNYTNPRWLEWGRAFLPQPGDSGSGVFVFRRDATTDPRPVLIGVVVGRSERGGGASLLSKRFRWLDPATRLQSPPG